MRGPLAEVAAIVAGGAAVIGLVWLANRARGGATAAQAPAGQSSTGLDLASLAAFMKGGAGGGQGMIPPAGMATPPFSDWYQF